jgi:4-hydroxy-2-oxoglutarate aldolase
MDGSTDLSLAGVFPPIPTPFDPRGEIAFDALSTNLERWNAQPLRGYVVGGSNGEFVSQTPDERVAVVKAVRRETSAGRLVIAGAGMQSLRGTSELGDRMAEAGADALIVVTPSYYKSSMAGETLEAYYEGVADHAQIPVVLYNVPRNTGVDLPLESVVRLSGHPNIVGIKESGGDLVKIGRLVHECLPGFKVLAGSAGFLLAALVLGANGVIGALANIAGAEMADLVRRFVEGDIVGARRIQLRLLAVNSAVTSGFGVAGLKAAMDILGYYGGPVRAPLQDLDAAARMQLAGTLQAAELSARRDVD